MFTIKHTSVTIPVENYIRDYCRPQEFITYCQQCANYGHSWACPPFDFNTQAYVARFKNALIIGTKAIPSEATVAASTTVEKRKEFSAQGLTAAWQSISPFIFDCEKRHHGSISLCGIFSCRLCSECTRHQGKPCRHPNEMRHSLESMGFDVAKTARELLKIDLKWAKDEALPEYLTLVTAVMSDDDLSEEVLPGTYNQHNS